jgi:hypothetical protein
MNGFASSSSYAPQFDPEARMEAPLFANLSHIIVIDDRFPMTVQFPE